MKSDNTLIQKLRGLLPEKTIPFLFTELGNQLELLIDGPVQENHIKTENPFEGLQPDDLLSAQIEDRFYTLQKREFIPTELAWYLTDPSASIFVSKEMGQHVGVEYFEVHNRVLAKVLEKDSKYKPIYRSVQILFGRNIGSRTFYCLMGAAIQKP